MRVFLGFDNVPAIPNAAVTTGSFDGVHTGHRAIIDTLKATARKTGGQSVVVTFDPHPRKVVPSPDGKRVELLNTLEEKKLLLESCGVDNLVVAPFTDALRQMPHDRFFEECMIGRLHPAALVIGYDHRFGHGRQGGFEALGTLAAAHGVEMVRVPEYNPEGKVSSTIIRELIRRGEMKKAAEALGYDYFFIGRPQGGAIEVPDPDKLLPQGRYEIAGEGVCFFVDIAGRSITPQTPVPPIGTVFTFLSR